MKLKTFKFPSFKEWKKTAFMGKKMGNIGDFYAEIQINGNIYKAVLNYSYPGSSYKVYENTFNYDITKPDELEKWYNKIQKDMNSYVERHAVYDVLHEYRKELTRYFDDIDVVKDSENKKADSLNEKKENALKVELPYKIGTKLQTYENGKIQHDYVFCYIIGDSINVKLMLCYDTNPRLSIPISLDDLKKNWKPLKKKAKEKDQ